MTTAKFILQRMSTYAMRETAKQMLSSERVMIHADNVMRTDRVDDEGRFQALQFGFNGSVTRGLWSPDGDWGDPINIPYYAPGTFTPDTA